MDYQLSNERKLKVYFAADHAGFEYKEQLVAFVRDELGFEAEDVGAYVLNEEDDYPDFVQLAAEVVSRDQQSKAIVLGGSGQGEAIVANRFPRVRAAVWYGGNRDILTLSRKHNDANVLSIGARFVSQEEAREAVRLWLLTPFSKEERHERRIEKTDTVFHTR